MDCKMQVTESESIDVRDDDNSINIVPHNNEQGDEDEDDGVENGEMEEAADDDDYEEVAAERWIDVKDLRNMTLDELKALKGENGKGDADRRLDLPITKVVVRRLPPQITVEDYLQELSEVPSYSYIRLVPPNEDLPSRIGRRSSIYINFDTEEEAFWFKEKYNNMKFFDERGNSYIACVDFSFIQDVAQDPPDEPLVGTLEESEMYKEFLKAYEEEPWSFTMNRPVNIPTPEAMLDEILNKKCIEPDSTPLLQFLREKSQKKDAARKEREQRRKERDIARRKQKEEIAKRRQKEKEEAAKRKQKDKEEAVKRKPLEEVKDREKGDKLSKDDHKKSEEQLTSTKKTSSSEKLPVEKSTSDHSSSSKTKDISKPAFGKPFPSTSVTEESDTKTKMEDGSADGATKTNEEGGASAKKETNADGITKKRVIKRVIKVRKIKENGSAENGDDAANSQQSGPSDSKPKKIIRVVKKTSKPADNGNNTKSSADAANKKAPTEDNTEGKASTSGQVKDDTEKERKSRKSRPEIQIYRPGSLRGGASKSTSSGDKEKKSDNI